MPSFHKTPASFKICWMTPLAPSCQVKYLLDNMHFRIGLETTQDGCALSLTMPTSFQVELWTNLYHKEYNEGQWHAVPMKYQGSQQTGDKARVTYMYAVDLLLTCLGKYSFTYRAKSKLEQDYQWAGLFEKDGVVKIQLPVKHYTTWIQEPESAQITHNIYLGNYSAAMTAPEDGFDCLLNMADDAHVFAQQFVYPIIFKKLPVPAGANNVISEEIISTAVKWLRAMSDRCRKIMVCSRSGHGRAGSILLAFIFFMNPNLTFEEAYSFVNKRFFIYNHRGLQCDLTRIFRNKICVTASDPARTNALGEALESSWDPGQRPGAAGAAHPFAAFSLNITGY